MPVTFRRATATDLPIMTDIYNQAIRRGGITDDDQPVTIANRQVWLQSFTDHFSLWTIEMDQEVVGFVGLEEFFPHPNFYQTAQICLYLDGAVQGQGVGRQALSFIDQTMVQLGIKTIVAYIYADNLPSQKLFTKMNYKYQGDLPRIAHVRGAWATIKTYVKNYK